MARRWTKLVVADPDIVRVKSEGGIVRVGFDNVKNGAHMVLINSAPCWNHILAQELIGLKD